MAAIKINAVGSIVIAQNLFRDLPSIQNRAPCGFRQNLVLLDSTRA